MTLIRLTVSPNAAQMTIGTSVSLVATGWHDDGTTVDVTGMAAWESGTPTVAVVVAGVVTGITPGSAVVAARLASPPLSGSCVVDVAAPASICWDGQPSAFEARMARPLPTYALESLRQRFVLLAVNDQSIRHGVRAVLQMAMETEMRAILLKMVDLAADVSTSNVCSRRGYLDIDKDMQRMRFLIGPALDELAALSAIPSQYVDLVRRYASSAYARYRMGAIAAALCLATAVGVP